MVKVTFYLLQTLVSHSMSTVTQYLTKSVILSEDLKDRSGWCKRAFIAQINIYNTTDKVNRCEQTIPDLVMTGLRSCYRVRGCCWMNFNSHYVWMWEWSKVLFEGEDCVLVDWMLCYLPFKLPGCGGLYLLHPPFRTQPCPPASHRSQPCRLVTRAGFSQNMFTLLCRIYFPIDVKYFYKAIILLSSNKF